MNISYLIGVIALSVVVLPIMVVIFFVGVAGLVARVGSWKMSRELSPEFRSLSLEEAT
jgi:flagellar biosynthesis protein FlhB